jgi:putative SOS response-associated peptidase YedK
MLSDSVACANSKYMLMPMSWGLAPQYAKHQSPGGGATSKPPNNARLDTLQKTLKTNKGMFRNALVNNQRCIMVVDGYKLFK